MKPVTTLLLLLLGVFCSAHFASAQTDGDSKLKSWMSAELLGVMRWGKDHAEDKKSRLDFASAELVCFKRTRKQIEEGLVSRTLVAMIAEKVRKSGQFRGHPLTMTEAELWREKIMKLRFLDSLKDD
jgi:hypothetical protein